MQRLDLSRAKWHKSRRSSATGQCVEVAYLGQAVAVRDSKDPDGPKLTFTCNEWASFVSSLKDSDSALG